MIVEIHGAGFRNKGAELMLRTTVGELRSRVENFVPVIDPGYGSYESRCELKLRQIFPERGHVGKPSHSKNLRRQALYSKIKADSIARKIFKIDLSAYGCVGINRVSALIDISGFAYTDQWSTKPTEDFSNLAKFYNDQNKPVIMLPQAFGPFKSGDIASQFRKAINNSSLIFPRDKASLKYVEEVLPDSGKVFQAPDITLFNPRKNIQNNLDFENYMCLVPNTRMLDQGKENWGEKYELYLLEIARRALENGLKVYLVIHDSSGQDSVIAHRLFDKLNSEDVFLVDEPDPYKLKKIIGKSKIVVGSRFHSLVASFSQGVPAIAIGWSHKYEMLFEDFGFEKFIVSSDAPLDNVLDMVSKLSNDDENTFLRKQITQKLVLLEEKNQKMWDLVAEVLNQSVN